MGSYAGAMQGAMQAVKVAATAKHTARRHKVRCLRGTKTCAVIRIVGITIEGREEM